MRWAFAITLFAVAAHADQSTPEVQGKPGVQERCAARLERARDELAKRDPQMKSAIVEVRADENYEQGDPTARGTHDVIVLRLDGYTLASVKFGVARLHVGYGWLDEGEWRTVWRGGDRLGFVHRGHSAQFEKLAMPAVDDCLKMKTPQ